MTSKRNHIGFVSLLRTGSGGSEMLWTQAARQLKAEGFRITVFHHVKPGVKDGLKLWADIAESVNCLPKRMNLVHRIFEVCRRLVMNHEPESKFRSTLRRIRPELVIINCGGHLAGNELAEDCRALHQPYAVIVQLANNLEWPSDSFRDTYKNMYLCSELNVFVSHQNLEIVEAMLGQRLKNAVIIRNPCLLTSEQRNLPWPSEATPVQMALPARLDIHDKGHNILLHLLAQPKWLDREWLLNLYGQGRHEQGIRDLSHLLGLGNRVRFFGHVADPAEIWRNNHLLVMPSRAEGLPLALIEAMHVGRPSVVTDVGGNRELVVDGETGFIADASTTKSISDALERAWQAQDQWPEIGQQARRKVEALWQEDPAEHLAGRIKAVLVEAQ